ncbi:sigma-54-dependent transcriptional regulator [Roseateles terrae]|uniref:Two-component system C4-dicarboxylate transport response regulator DctD n=1 Tax=Roseateles terrae TaxID=431060 RepID=A0ABR6GMU2_9BURK|nr:sigma-54 dependent transcriptional regulator [Roseateles terrae]MBB3193402.1 two-component system C4-dicarboxylate transport response regulator DctD [Roseateles terrae]OWQ89408.1 Fis family transcriptional regulator [Roseateles terrae]
MFEGYKVVFVEDDLPVRVSLTQTLELEGLEVLPCRSAEEALPHIQPGAQVVMVTDVRLPGMDGRALLDHVRATDPGIPVILITAHGDVQMAVQAMRTGAYDFIEKPFAPERLIEAVMRALDLRMLRHSAEELRAQLQRASGIEAVLLGRSAAMQQLRRQILNLAGTSADVMILGETGTGKELVARCLHDQSPRRDRHFVAINCGGLPEALFESELFGHEPGSFTSAAKRRIGKIEHANGGTLLLDEIETMPVPLQIKLLRVLQERRIERLGSNEELPINVRFIAASKADLKELGDRGQFRNDLYYRLNIATLQLPPLRERREDIPLLFEHFVAQACARYERPAPELTPEKLRELMAHDWPGNVREIRNAADRFVLALDDLDSQAALQDLPSLNLARQMELVEKALIEQALRRTQGKVPAAMELLGTPRKTLYDKLHRHGIQLDDFR